VGVKPHTFALSRLPYPVADINQDRVIELLPYQNKQEKLPAEVIELLWWFRIPSESNYLMLSVSGWLSIFAYEVPSSYQGIHDKRVPHTTTICKPKLKINPSERAGKLFW